MLFDNPNLLSNEEIKGRLLDQGHSLELVDKIIQQFWIHDWGNSFISDKSRFALLEEFLKTHKEDASSRTSFYKFFFEKNVSDVKKYLPALEKIAMVFELMQTDQLEEEDFSSLLSQLKIDNSLNLKFFIDANLMCVINEEEKKYVKWLHHTLTEYLSADYILHQKELSSTINRFACSSETGVISFIPSWIGTLSFLTEQKPEAIIDWVDSNLKSNPDFLTDSLSEVLIYITPASIDEKYSTKLFSLVFDTYQTKKWWIPVWAYHNLYKFINEEIYSAIKKNSASNVYENRGNIAAVIDGMMQNDHPLMTVAEKAFWKTVLLKYATEEISNGVLQRHALAALENYPGDDSIIDAVAENGRSTDSLVREAFINLCKSVNPNSPTAISFFIDGISKDTSHIYSRNALYSVNSKEGIKELLKGISNNQEFIHEFLDKESIFNKEERQADEVIVENIEKNIDEESASLLKTLIVNAFSGEKNYRAGDSYFLRKVALILKAQDANYLDNLISSIKSLEGSPKNHFFINDFEGVLSVLLEPEDLERLKEIFTDDLHTHAGYALAEAVRLAPRNGNPLGEEVLKKGIELGITADPANLPQYEDQLKNREGEIVKRFRGFLSTPAEKKYYPEVFRTFVENQKIIQKEASKEELERLLDLALNSNLNKIEPEKIKVHYKDRATRSGQYTISAFAQYFPDVLQVIYLLKPELFLLAENRKKAINFIPFAYSSDFKILQDILGEIKDEELATVNQIMTDVDNDARYLVPQTYIYFARTYPNLKTPKEVLLSFLSDRYISESDKEYALKTLENYVSSTDTEVEKKILSLWNKKGRDELSDTANAFLITVFKNEEAIDWRFQAIVDGAAPFKRQEGAHSVGTLEMELDFLAFAKPLIELKDEKYLYKFIQLLDFSLELNKDEKYTDYTNYIWRIAISFVVRENFFLSEKAYETLKTWAEKHRKTTNVNWFDKRLEMALSDSKNVRTRKNKVSEAVAELNS